MKCLLAFMVVAAAVSACNKPDDDVKAIRQIMEKQEAEKASAVAATQERLARTRETLRRYSEKNFSASASGPASASKP